MSLLRPREQRRRSRIRSRTVVTCPLNGHQAGWCRQLCEPQDGLGTCGRTAPHGLVGRTQAAIAAYNRHRG